MFFRAFILALAVLIPASVLAAPLKYVVLPFEVNGPEQYRYLSKAVQSMLSSRLNWRDKFEPVPGGDSKIKGEKAPASPAEAVKIMRKVDADYLVSGSVSVVGNTASVDATMQSEKGESWTEAKQVDMEQLIPGLEQVANALRSNLFQMPGSKTASDDKSEKPQAESAKLLNPDFMPGDPGTGADEMGVKALNPRFRYVNTPEDGNRWRGQRLDFPSQAMVVGPLDSTGKNYIVLGSDSALRVYEREGRKMRLVAESVSGGRFQFLTVKLYDFDRDGDNEIVCAGVLKPDDPSSKVFDFDGKNLAELHDNVNFYLNVIRMPPTFKPVLLGQKKGYSTDLFQKNAISEVHKQGGELVLGRRIQSPEFANVFNISYLPFKGDEAGDYKVILIDSGGHLKVYTKDLTLQAQTDETYNDSNVGIPEPYGVPGLPVKTRSKAIGQQSFFYVPIPPVVAVLGTPGRYEFLANKNISAAAQVFDRYRTFSQGEIHSLFWDGIGMNLYWKTRRIKGTVFAYDVADVDNDGVNELVVGVNTFPGALGFSQRKTIVMAYELDMNSNN